jgi:hypothetical protein
MAGDARRFLEFVAVNVRNRDARAGRFAAVDAGKYFRRSRRRPEWPKRARRNYGTRPT